MVKLVHDEHDEYGDSIMFIVDAGSLNLGQKQNRYVFDKDDEREVMQLKDVEKRRTYGEHKRPTAWTPIDRPLPLHKGQLPIGVISRIEDLGYRINTPPP